MIMSLQIALTHHQQVLQESRRGDNVYLAYQHHYALGDQIQISTDQAPVFIWAQLDAALKPALIYVSQKQWAYQIPFNTEREWPYPDGAFAGKNHYATVRVATTEEISTYRNWAENSHDQREDTGAYPHASANAETRDEPVFFARNAIDGMVANESHGNYPFQSWGIAGRADAELDLALGHPVEVDKIVLVLRADYPHDSYWTSVTVAFSDGSQEVWQPKKTAEPQVFAVTPRVISGLRLINLVKDADASNFPALTELQVFGKAVL
jgi:hypothetical protein